jgi:hypothetical protein
MSCTNLGRRGAASSRSSSSAGLTTHRSAACAGLQHVLAPTALQQTLPLRHARVGHDGGDVLPCAAPPTSAPASAHLADGHLAVTQIPLNAPAHLSRVNQMRGKAHLWLGRERAQPDGVVGQCRGRRGGLLRGRPGCGPCGVPRRERQRVPGRGVHARALVRVRARRLLLDERNTVCYVVYVELDICFFQPISTKGHPKNASTRSRA